MRDVAVAVREARRGLGVTQAQLAENLGVGRDWVVRLEQGAPRLEAQKVLDALVILGIPLTVGSVRAEGVDESDPFAAVFDGLR